MDSLFLNKKIMLTSGQTGLAPHLSLGDNFIPQFVPSHWQH